VDICKGLAIVTGWKKSENAMKWKENEVIDEDGDMGIID
jgi:hypothetical protein